MASVRQPRVALAFAALVLAAAAWPAVAQDAPLSETHHDVIVQRATVQVSFEPDLNRLAIVQPDVDGTETTQPETCANQGAQKDVLGGTFSFEESGLQTGCADFLIDLDVPPGVGILRVNFTANRDITNATENAPGLNVPRAMQQLLVVNFTTADGEPAGDRFDYFDERGGSQPPTAFVKRYLLEGTQQVRVRWHFEDRGNDQTRPLGFSIGEGFEATISNINFTWEDYPLAPAPAQVSEERVSADGDQGTVDYLLRLDVPQTILQPEESFPPSSALRSTAKSFVEVAVVEGPTLLGLRGPRGEVTEDEYLRTEGNRQARVLIPESVVAVQGPGTYELHFQSVRRLPPPPAPEEPTRIYAFYFILALLPLVAAALAIHQTTVYVRQAEGAYRRTAYPIAVAVGLVVLYYLVLLSYSLFGIGPRAMSTLPLVREAVLVYIQLVLLLIMLAAAALAVSRTLMGSMRRDIAERERKEDQLRRSNEELERFAYVASHDLQEPLRKVAGFTALLQKKYAGRLDKDADEIIGYAVDGATRMQMLIKDILAYSRVGSRELQRVQVDAGAVMELVTNDLDLPIKESKARVSWKELPTVRADASQLRQVLQNLVENSIKYSKPGRRPVIQVTGGADGDNWHFEVKDNGIGIPEDKHEEIFGIFRRLHGQDTRGTGIGLAVAKKAVERHGGKIWVESKPGHGSTFHFTIPRTTLEDTLARPTSRRAASRAASA